jgi:hypothetical protein
MGGRPFVQSIAAHSRAAVATLLLLGVAVLLARPIAGIPILVPKNYNEGWNALQALRAVGNGPLYPDPAGLVANNYPPVSFYVVGALGSLTGDNIVAGRLVALFGFGVTAVLVGMVTRRMSGSRHAGTVSALLFAGYAASLHAGYIGMNDPQWLAHAIMSIALYFVVARPDPTHRPWLLMLVTAALLAGLTKHNLLALPVAISLWLLIYDRRSLWFWIGFSIFLLAGASGALYAAYGPEFFQGVFGFQRGYSPSDIAPKLEPWAGPLVPLVGAFVCFVFIEPPSRDKTLLLIYVVVASAWGVYALGGAGVNMNVMYDALIGLAIIAGMVVHRAGERLRGVSPSFSTGGVGER